MLVTVEELVDHMSGPTLTPGQQRAAERTLKALETQLRNYLRRPVEISEHTEDVWPDADGQVFLRQTPVHSIISVDSIARPDLAVTWWPQPSGFTTFPYGGLMRVTYTAGLDGRALGMDLALLEVATRVMSTRHDDTLSVTGFNMSQKEPTGPQRWTRDELAQFYRYKHRVAV